MIKDEPDGGDAPLSILHLEDSGLDAALVAAALARGGLRADLRRVEDEAGYVEALSAWPIALILSDYALPDFDGLSALDRARSLRPEVPFLFVSGVMGEEVAIESLQRGATDYVLKQRLERLVPAVRRALAESRERADRRRAEVELRRSEARYRALSERLAESDARKDAFLATLAHELRNPLAALKNGLRAARLPRVGAEDRRRLDRMMDRQAAQLERLLDDLLDLSRVNTGKIELRTERVELTELLEFVADSLRPSLDERRHRLTVDAEPGRVYLDADAPRLTQVFANLLSNASKYTPDGGRIRVSVAREGDEVAVSIRDQGIGISAEDLPRIFDLFVQVGGDSERSRDGLGIGLTLVRSLVELHGGRVDAESDGIGRGSTFTVRLRALEAGAGPGPEVRDGPEAWTQPISRTVLLCDDNRDGAESLALILGLNGHEVLLAHDGPGAIALARGAARPIDLILLDIGMPGMSGYQVARHLRADPSFDGTWLAALTGWGTDRDRRLAHEAGFDHHFTKPVDPDALQRYLESHHHRDATVPPGPSADGDGSECAIGARRSNDGAG